MCLFDYLKNKTTGIVPIADMISFGLEWRDKYLANYASRINNGVRVESFIYCCWFVWYHCLQHGRVSKDEYYVTDFFAHIMANLQEYDTRFEDLDFFIPLFKNRYSIFRDDLTGLINSHYPETKQYLPIRTYKAFCLQPLTIINPSAASLSSLTQEQDDEMTSFVGEFIRFTNEMSKAVRDRF